VVQAALITVQVVPLMVVTTVEVNTAHTFTGVPEVMEETGTQQVLTGQPDMAAVITDTMLAMQVVVQDRQVLQVLKVLKVLQVLPAHKVHRAHKVLKVMLSKAQQELHT
jgi:hypothetical protein